ncbi:M60 family metallopeptidase [Mucilaginibacter sp. UR6-11]|uniref:M60 family metallopeptidase n=1 Tax=Mucilaginibacter sp. UR6-11 TaxID=1435644 RepID=UPI001E38E4D7|nr:M60 family metallopeptidase [Mucilaginibacter sp. UR6-11]MCC8425254.1 M60 family metallopeptidase [Mucilaginibacter sp. UR6-11]
MACRSYCILTCVLLLITGAFSLKAQSTASKLLTHVDSLHVPSPSKPVLNNTPELKRATKIGYREYNLLQDFDHHPEAKAVGYKIFPGDVPANATRVNQTVTIPVKVGTQPLNDPGSVYYRAHSTGLYVPAGEKVTITINDNDIKQYFRAQIGVHNDDVTHLDEFKRIPFDLTVTFRLDAKQVDVYSPYGGLLLINIADTTSLKTVTLNVKGAVKAPYFKLGETSEADWNLSIRNNPGPWAELATDNIVLTVPSYRIRKLDNPVKLMKFWDEVMNADADLAAMPQKRMHHERIIIDNDVAYGYMFTTLDKIVSPDDESCEWMLNEQFIRSHGSWGTFHELGHRHQYWPFEDGATQEVTVNLYTMYVYDKVLHKGIYQHEGMESRQEVIAKIMSYISSPDAGYNKWAQDPFLALAMYIQIIDAFGWNAIKTVNAAYRNTPKDQFPKTAQQKIDFRFITLCKATNSNLSRFFEVWRIPVSYVAKKQVEGHKEWFPPELGAYK